MPLPWKTKNRGNVTPVRAFLLCLGVVETLTDYRSSILSDSERSMFLPDGS
jgi:hypothetical protein